MACPYFRPVERFSTATWLREPRFPLGAEWRGLCVANAAAEHAPPEQTQRDTCNSGYGRGACSWFPAEAEVDAIRFSVVQERDGALTVRYILEREYAPASHGTFECTVAGPIPAELPAAVARQAAAFLEAHACRKPRA